MITAILEDKKGFRKSMDIPRLMSCIRIAIPPNLPTVVYWGNKDDEITIEILEFYFEKWLVDNEIALYRENKQ